MNGIRSVIRSIPPLHRAARRTRQMVGRVLNLQESYGRFGQFFTLSPNVLIALVQALSLQQQRVSEGRNLFDGHGYYEFGLFRGFSFWFAEQITRAYAGAGLQLYGFDSFEGLPAPELEVEAVQYSKGSLRCSYEQVRRNLCEWGADPARMQLFKGFYSDDMFRQLRARVQFPPVCICLIDVDLYASCVPVLEFIREYLVEGSILLFDDYHHFGKEVVSGERMALREFESRNPRIRLQHLFDYGWEGVAFRVLAV